MIIPRLLFMYRPLTLLLIISTFFSCKKKEINPNIPQPPSTTIDTVFTQNFQLDTVHPSDYLMMYPGSWWTYTNGHTDNCTSWGLVSIFSKTATNSTVFITENRRYMPKTSGSYYSFQSRITNNIETFTTTFYPLLDTIPRVLWAEHSYSGEGSQSQHHVFSIESFGNIGAMDANDITYNDVIHVQRKSVTHHHFGAYTHYKHDYYYARGVGLIKVSGVSQGTPITPVELVNYYIAPH